MGNGTKPNFMDVILPKAAIPLNHPQQANKRIQYQK